MMLDRRRLIAGLFALVLAAASVACGGGSSSSAPAANAPATTSATATQAASGASKPLPRDVINTFYPEYPGAKLSVHGSLSVVTDPKVPTILYDLAGFELRAAAIRAIYTTFESIAQQDLALDGPNDETIEIGGRENTSRTFVLIPDGAPKPRSTVSDFIKTRDPVAATTYTKGKDTFSYVEMTSDRFTDGFFKSVQEFGTFNFAIEVCQSTVQATPVDPNGVALNDATLSQDAQEVVCNSIGAAVAARSLGMSYKDYQSFATTHPIRITNGRSPALLVPNDDYAAYPTAGAIIR
jgi:hypothetical protein